MYYILTTFFVFLRKYITLKPFFRRLRLLKNGFNVMYYILSTFLLLLRKYITFFRSFSRRSL